MILLVKLRCTESCPYEMQYHYHLQGFIYSLLEGSRYHYVHNKEGYKFFCFSNIFPVKDLVKNDVRTLIISSPDSGFISYLEEILLHPSNLEVKVGCMRFKIDYIDKLNVKLPNRSAFTLITALQSQSESREKSTKLMVSNRKAITNMFIGGVIILWIYLYPKLKII